MEPRSLGSQPPSPLPDSLTLWGPASVPPLFSLFCTDTVSARSTPHLDDFAHDDIDSYMIAMETTAGSEGSRAPPCIALLPSPQPKCSPSPCSEDEDEDEAEPSTVPGTPPPKKVGAGGGGRDRREEGAGCRTHSASCSFSSAHCSSAPSWLLHTPPRAPVLCWLRTAKEKAELRNPSLCPEAHKQMSS